MDIIQVQLKDKYPNIACSKCNGLMSVCLDIFCTSQRIFCSDCTSLNTQQSQQISDLQKSQQGLFKQYIEQNFHKGHQQQIFCMGKLLEMQGNEKIIFESHQMEESPMSKDQKEVYIGLMKQVDDFEKEVAHQFKLLRANINEKYNLISSSFDSSVQTNASEIQNIISKYREDYKQAFEVKIQEFLKSFIHPVHYNFSIFKSNIENIKETALDHIKSLQNQIKLQNKIEINQLLENKWNSAIHDMTSYKNCFVLCGEAMRLYTPEIGSKKLVKSFDFNINDTIRCVQVSRDGSILAAGGNGKLILFNTENMKIIFNQVNSASSIQYYSVDISPDNKYFAFSLKNKKTSNNLFVFDISNSHTDPKVKHIFSDHNSLILSTKFSNDGKFLFSSGCDYKIIVYAFFEDSNQFKKVQVLRDNDDIINDIAIDNNSKCLVSVSTDGKCYIYTRKQDEQNISADKEVNKAVTRQQDFERLNKVKYDVMEQEDKKQTQMQLEQEKQESQNSLFMRSPHQNPFLAQSLLQDQNYIKYQIQNNQQECDLAIQKAKDENIVYENFEDFFELQGYFSLVGKKSISSVDINNSGNMLALSSGEDVLIYDITQKNQPRLITCLSNTSISIINKVKFSQYENVIYTCDQSGSFQSFKYF